VPKKSGIDKIT
jgi:radial spoke head protein 3